MKLVPVVLAGGNGTRLWPMSRRGYPKQFLPLLDDRLSLFQQTVLRARYLGGTDALTEQLVICGEHHRFIVAEQLQQLSESADISASIILEPCGRNTAAAIALASLWCQQRGLEDAPMLVMPSDQTLTDMASFDTAVKSAVEVAREGAIVTFGVEPNRPETGYGYIQTGAHLHQQAWQVQRFVEKPDAATAERYITSGDYYWNSGMFVLTPSAYLQELNTHARDIAEATAAAFEECQQDHDFLRVDEALFAQVRSESIDYAVMEPTEKAAVVALMGHWSDVGSWNAVADELPVDAKGNHVHGDVCLVESENCLVRADSRLVAAIGLQDVVVVETPDAVLVSDRNSCQQVKQVVALLESDKRSETHHHQRVYRPWGWYESICNADRFQVKRIQVKPGEQLSLQMHHHRAEHWVVVKGTAKITRGEEEVMLTEDQSTYIPLGVKHRLANPGLIPLEIIEVQTGAYLGEDDIVRFVDEYGRS